ncbi:DUF1639 family protein [Melia azedarach]|uniref:DUF1639 family protein n=1 Tax=Melia azedarach TaxID=155640 RepID=A0ACC1YV70_MELAZ|nr:DUF1639 family protein [Melia azedarach]
MGSTVSFGNISLPQLGWTAANPCHRKLSDDMTPNTFQDDSSDSMGSRFNLAVETSEHKSKASDDGGKTMWKFSTIAMDQNQTLVSTEFEEPGKVETSKNRNKVSDVANQTLVSKNCNAGEPVQPESTQLGIVPEIKESAEKKKRSFSTFSVSLAREKIEADLLAMGGSKRSRRVKRRPKNVQRQLDDLFPGLRLKYITPDDYRVRMA